MEKIFFHIDVNSAFLSWTAINRLANGDPVDLREIPSIIGGDSEKRHGIVLAKSIPAKKYGIQTAEPVVNAFRKCPFLVTAPPDHTLYKHYSKQLMNYLRSVCPDIEQVSIDECYMDFTPVAEQYASPEHCAAVIRETVLKQLGFTVNVGISDRKVLAKMASDFQKPNKTHTLFSHEIKQKMWPLPVSSLFMCGKSSVEALKKLEILTIGDLAQTDLSIIEAHLKSHGRLLWEYANGIDDSKIESVKSEVKGVGNSTTLARDAVSFEEAAPILLSLSESVASRLRKAGQRAQMVSVEIKYSDFKTVSHQTTFYTPVDSASVIYKTACDLFHEIWNHAPIRLLGIRTSRLVSIDEPTQLSIFDLQQPQTSEKQHKLDEAIDQIRNRFGKEAITRGSLLKKD